MRNAQKPDHVSLINLIARLKDGRYVIPDFQREFEWRARDIRDLVASVFRDYYIGSLLLWKGNAQSFDALDCQPIHGVGGGSGREYIVLDGQQRLTALHYALVAPPVAPPRHAARAFYVIRVDRFLLDQSDESFDYYWDGRPWQTLSNDREAQYAQHIFPLSIIGEGGFALANWAQGYERHWRSASDAASAAGDETAAASCAQHAEGAHAFGQFVNDLTQQYQISYVALDEDLGVEKICDIFTQINSRGIRLDIFDLLNAMLRPKGIQLKSLWRENKSGLAPDHIEKMNVYVLQVMSILKQSYCSSKYLYFLLPGVTKPVRDPDGTRRSELLITDDAAFLSMWAEAVQALRDALKLLTHPSEFGVSTWTYLPYKTILPVFAALLATLSNLPPVERLAARRKFELWYWASVFTNQYSASSESTSARDFGDVRRWWEDDSLEPKAVSEFRTTHRSLALEGELKQGTSRYNGVFNLLVMNGARDWISGEMPQPEALHDHHIIPRSWGGKREGVGDRINSILNRTPLTAETNVAVIGDRLPNAYLPELIERSGEAQVRGVLESHFISSACFDILLREPFTVEDYDAFLQERHRAIGLGIESLILRDEPVLPSNLRALDNELADVEIGLRGFVAERVTIDDVPEKLRERIEPLVERAGRGALADTSRHADFAQWLEFADLRHLEEMIKTGRNWPKFEALFRTKDELTLKFNQLANARNAIRHVRHINPVEELEGRAAAMWFRSLLERRDA